MKRFAPFAAMFMILATLLCSCGEAAKPADTTNAGNTTLSEESTMGETTAELTTAEITTAAEVTTAGKKEPESGSLNGKKIIFIGNSFIYYGGIVTKGNTRGTDTGVFYQVCKANGDNVKVYDCTYGGHHLYDFTTAGCKTSGCDVGVGGDLLSGIDFYNMDVVVLSESGDNNPNFLNDCKNIMARFTNPETVFVYMCHTYSYTKNHTNITSNLDDLQNLGVVIVDWGSLCYDVYTGTKSVPGTVQKYEKNSFVNRTSSDTYHPNPLAGYIASQMVYCALTSKSAQGQSYSFLKSLNYGAGSTSFSAYTAKYYTEGTTNFTAIVDSASDMAGLQKLMDAYLKKWNLGAGFDIPKPKAACEHTFNEGVIVTAATDKLPGKKTYTCTKCGATKDETLPIITSERTNVALGGTALIFSASKTSVGTASVLVDGEVGDNSNGRVDGGYTASGNADLFGGKTPKDTTAKLKIEGTGGERYEYWYAVQIDLGTARTVDGVTVYAQGYKRTVLDSGADILVSKDGKTWTRVYVGENLLSGSADGKGWENYVESDTATATSAAPAYLEVNFEAVGDIRYVMYGCTAYRGINGYYTTRFTEFKVFGK